MSLIGYWEDDEREDGTLTRVEPEHSGYYSVTSSAGWSCSVSAEYGVEPKVGDRFVTWGRFGRPIRGMMVNDRVLYYRTPDEQQVEDSKQAERAKADRVAEYEGKRSDFDRRVVALPDVMHERVEGFRAHGGDEWRWSYESYELMVCEEAAKLAARFPVVEDLKAFAALEPRQQRLVFPDMDEGHSGNSWGQSVRLAHLFLDRPDLVPKMHGALCPLVGCEDYGCYASRAPESGASV